MTNVIPDPDFEGFDGIYAGSKDGLRLPPNEHDLPALGAYLDCTGKEFKDLTQEEIDQFKFDLP